MLSPQRTRSTRSLREEEWQSPFETMGKFAFSDDLMREKVSQETYDEFQEMHLLTPKARDEIVSAIWDWAQHKGAIRTAHLFFPLRMRDGRSQIAYKVDGMLDTDHSAPTVLSPIMPKKMDPFTFFQTETDGSSFPSGGLRTTHRAAAFVSWDKESPPYIIGDTLFLPSAFISRDGDSLDHKVPLLRAKEAVNREGTRLLHNLGDTASTGVYSNLGWEQEYFLIPQKLWEQRPDLVNCGRTLFGALPPRNQEGAENYFAPPPAIIAEFMSEVQLILWDLGITINVNHNEVAPSQHELSPIFTQSNLATDQNMITMEVMDTVAARHGLKVLWHEKPFDGINGSGKHANWSLCNNNGSNIFKPGESEEAQTKFFAFTAAIAHAVAKHGDLLRVGVSGAGNDHRLGAQEAPPAIISFYTGVTMEEHIKSIVAGGPIHGYNHEVARVGFGTQSVEPVEVGIEDRNRTAPFPFCGNRFEFRAVGSGQNISFPLTCLNTAVAEGCAILSERIESGVSIRDAVADMFKENMHAIFTGNGYSAEWPIEAERRGLPNLHNTPVAVATFNSAKNKKLFSSLRVLTEREVDARQVVMFEEYTNLRTVEAQTAINMCNQGILQTLAAQGSPAEAKVRALVGELEQSLHTLEHDSSKSVEEKAMFAVDDLLLKMNNLRAEVDQAELHSASWPFPSYEQILHHHHTKTQV